MVGISSYGAYIPVYRLGQKTIGWNLPVEKAVHNFDEDSITMAVAAGRDCLSGINKNLIDGVFFASTTPPYMEKQGAAIVSEALDLRSDILTMDCTGSLRSGTSALRLALDSVKVGSSRNILVVASDCRMGAPRGEFDSSSGDGAAAFLISDSNPIAVINDVYSVSDQIIDNWRPEGEPFVFSWEDRFVNDEGYMKVMTDTISTFMQKHHYAPNAFTKAIYFGANARRHSELARKVGFDLKTQVQNPFFGKVGCAGTAFVPMLLVAALEEAKAADRFLVANYGDGCDVLTLQVTDLVGKVTPKRGIKGHINTKLIMPDYLEFISRWRGLVASEGARRPPNLPPSPSARRREDEANIRLHGVKCLHCGYEQFPPQRVCISCQTRDQFEKVRFADKKAKIFTFSQDYLAGTPDVPLVITVVDFQNGGRGVFMMTDRDREKEVTADAVVEMTFRKLRTTGGIHNYHWKTMPLRESIGVKEA